MNKTSSATLVIGSNSYIGSALVSYLKLKNKPVFGTTRYPHTINNYTIYLDLTQDVSKWNCPFPIEIAIICAGITSLKECKKNPQLTAHINVHGILALIKNLVEKGIFVIFLSSNQVFDGSIPFRHPNDSFSPITEYGHQKAEVERQIIQWKESISIIRLTKVVSPQVQPFKTWTQLLKNGKIVNPFSNMALCPIPLPFVIKVLHHIAQLRLPGILQVSGKRDFSYAEAAFMGAKLLKAPPHLIQPIEVNHSDDEPICKYTSLNTDCLKSILKLSPPDFSQSMKMTFT